MFFSYSEISELTSTYEPLESISDMLECLEEATRKIRQKGIRAIYKKLFELSQDSPSPFEQSLRTFTKQLIDQGGLSLLIHHLSLLTSHLPSERDLVLEQELRMLLSILYTILIILPCEDIENELGQHSSIIEDSLLSMIKLSTEYSYIPMKKVCMLLHRHLTIMLDSPKKHLYTPGTIKQEIPRYRLQPTAVEAFYVRTT